MFFFFNDTATTEIYTLSLHDALPISRFFATIRGQGARHERGIEQGQGRNSRRVRLYGCRAHPTAGTPSWRRHAPPDRRPPRRPGFGGGVSASRPSRPAEADQDRRGELGRGRPRVLRTAARHDAGGHRQAADAAEGDRPLGRFPPPPHPSLSAMARPRAPRPPPAQDTPLPPPPYPSH